MRLAIIKYFQKVALRCHYPPLTSEEGAELATKRRVLIDLLFGMRCSQILIVVFETAVFT